jgi:hypothetical protein
MKSKTTFLKLAYLLLTDNKFSGFDIPKPWTYLVQFMAFLTLKTTDKYQFLASLRAIYINMEANRGEFNYLQLPHFLTI